MEAKNKTTIFNLMVLDESGSMHSIYDAAVSGANETIQCINIAAEKYPDQKQFLTFVTFNTHYDGNSVKTIYDLELISKGDKKSFTSENFNPDGCTPLYDAIGLSVAKLEEQISTFKKTNPEAEIKVLVTIITDGEENSSRIFSGPMIRERISKMKEKGWIFAFIGANQDAIGTARNIGISNALNFAATEEGTEQMWLRERKSRMSFYTACECCAAEVKSDYNYFSEDEKV